MKWQPGLQWEPPSCKENNNQADITRVGHQAENSEAWDSAGREYCNCHEKKNQKCSFLMAGSRDKCQETNTWKESENVRLKHGNWQMALVGWNSITTASLLLTLHIINVIEAWKDQGGPQDPRKRESSAPCDASTFPWFSALLVSQCETGPGLAWQPLPGPGPQGETSQRVNMGTQIQDIRIPDYPMQRIIFHPESSVHLMNFTALRSIKEDLVYSFIYLLSVFPTRTWGPTETEATFVVFTSTVFMLRTVPGSESSGNKSLLNEQLKKWILS